MSGRVLVFLIRALLGLAGGWGLTYFFLTPKGQPVQWFIVAVLGALVVAAAYLSEGWRAKKTK